MKIYSRTFLLFLLILCLLAPAAVSAKAAASGGWTRKENGKWYYSSADGKPVSGWQTIALQ